MRSTQLLHSFPPASLSLQRKISHEEEIISGMFHHRAAQFITYTIPSWEVSVLCFPNISHHLSGTVCWARTAQTGRPGSILVRAMSCGLERCVQPLQPRVDALLQRTTILYVVLPMTYHQCSVYNYCSHVRPRGPLQSLRICAKWVLWHVFLGICSGARLSIVVAAAMQWSGIPLLLAQPFSAIFEVIFKNFSLSPNTLLTK